MPVLYSSNGKCIMVQEKVWASVLELAMRHGWTPAGTERPPVSLDSGAPDIRWEGVYEPPCGQLVIRGDAIHFARALGQALLSRIEEAATRDEISRIQRFSARGGFIIGGAEQTNAAGMPAAAHCQTERIPESVLASDTQDVLAS